MNSGSAVRKIGRYGAAAAGPIGSAGAQFLLSLALLRALEPGAFGSFAFLLIATQLSWGLWSAMFCAPLPILFHANQGTERERLMRTLFSSNLVVALLAAPLFWAMAIALNVPAGAALLFAAYGSVALLRWFARAYAYAAGRPLRTMVSDIAYALTLLGGIILFVLAGVRSLDVAYGTLLVAAVAGMLPFGPAYFARQFARISPASISGYFPIWRTHSGWSLLGVFTTEATANSHAYIVTSLYGPKAFAPIAASALLIRPISVAMNALTEFERAQMARAVGDNRIAEALTAVRTFRLAMITAWIVTAIAVALLLWLAPYSIFPATYPLPFMVTGAALWMAVAGVRLMRMPESTLLQAAGQFRPLALASVYSSGFSIIAVFVLLLKEGELWSIFGVKIGEGVYAAWIWRQCNSWLRRSTPHLGAGTA